MTLIYVLDLLAMMSAFAAGWLWFQSSRQRLRRLSRLETLDATDLNRLIVSINRTQILNGQAALAATMSALTAALRFALDAMVH
jgi:HAMP domain-containing protein